MFTKKISNATSFAAMLWVGAVTILFMIQQHQLFASTYGSPTVMAFLVAMFFVPMLVVYANSRTKNELNLLDQVLQLVFNIVWIGLGLIFIFANGNSSLLNSTLSFALLLVFIVVIKAVFSGKK
jgi:hypothetical protein